MVTSVTCSSVKDAETFSGSCDSGVKSNDTFASVINVSKDVRGSINLCVVD